MKLEAGEFLYKDLTYAVIGAAMEVHSVLGSGYLEAVYQSALAHELSLRRIPFEQLKRLPVYYKGVAVGDYQADFIVEDKVILELKATKDLHASHEAQALNYLTTTGYRLALLLNFGNSKLQTKRIVK